jgi:hypothetical protein
MSFETKARLEQAAVITTMIILFTLPIVLMGLGI